MITLTNVTKTYVSKKKKQKVDALRGVSFELANTGMVFILGKSGSGKSTLLNMLGGLDSPTTGQIVVDGVDMKDFKRADYEGYRNGYVGFIFQEFNLLDEFNIKDNIALALHLSKGDNIDERVVAALQQVELNEQYLTRRVDELSGGEKQRIAIARTIVKESKMILADEPTGNLDSATGESIWNILKELSKTKLVVVVSHDRESAEKYADRVIEIADGNVVADSGSQGADSEVNEPFTPQKKSLSFRACLKMGVNSLFQRKVRSICVVLIAILSIFAIIMTQMCLTYSAQITVAKFIRKYNVEHFVIENDRVPRSADKSFLNENCTYIKYSDRVGFVNSKQDITDMGWSFIGDAMELDLNSYYITSRALKGVENILDSGSKLYKDYYYYLDENDDKVFINKTPSSWEFIIGKRTNIGRGNDSAIVAGIVDVTSELSGDYIPRCFVLEGFSNFSNSPYGNISLNKADGIVHFGAKQFSGEMWIAANSSGGDIVVTENGLVKPYEITVGDGEIILNYEMLAAFFDVKEDYKYVGMPYYDYLLYEIPEQIGQTHPFKLYSETGELLVDLGELKIVGVSFNYRSRQDRLYCGLSSNDFRNLYFKTCRQFLVSTSSVKNIQRFVTTLNNHHHTEVIRAGVVHYKDELKNDSDCCWVTEEFETYIEFFTTIVTLISAVMTVLLILFVANLISLSIIGRKKEIGILSALGTSNKDIAKIFIIETMVIAVITFVMVFIASFVFAAVMNNHYSSDYMLVLQFFNVDLLTVGTLIVSSIGLMLLGALLPLIKIAKLKPIDAIRNT